MAWIPAVISLIGAAANAIGQHKSKKKEEDNAAAAAAAKDKADRQAWTNHEDTRIASLKSLLGGYGNYAGYGHKTDISVDPSLFNAKPYAGAPPTDQHSSTAGELLSGVGGLLGSTGAVLAGNQAQKDHKAELDRIQCILDPRNCPQHPIMGPSDSELGYDPNGTATGAEWGD